MTDWIRQFCLLYEVVSIEVPKCIYTLTPPSRSCIRYPSSITVFLCRTQCLKISLFHTIGESIRFFPKIRKIAMLKYMKHGKSKITNIHNQIDFELPTRLQLDLCKCKFRDNLSFKCSCNIDSKNTMQFFCATCLNPATNDLMY